MANSEIFASCSFSSLGLQSNLCKQLRERLGFEVPTQVQAQAIPVILSGRHVLVNASTGSGKTVAYLAPVIHELLKYNPQLKRTDGTFALVLVPTRELCLQVYEILHKLLKWFNWIVPGYVMGGENKSKEKARLRKGISILVATPGRLLDHLKNTSSFEHSKLRWLIFDEADRILELGFGKEIEEILDLLGSMDNPTSKDNMVANKCDFERQNLLLSATLDDKVNRLAKISLENPVMIGLDEKKMNSVSSHLYLGDDTATQSSITRSSPQVHTLPPQLKQKYVKASSDTRLVVLLSILKYLYDKEASQKIVVFFSTCDAVDFHYALLSKFQFTPHSKSEVELKKFMECKIFRLHGNMNQEDRTAAFQTFKTEKCALMLSTDVIARGIDVPKVRCIILYDSPGEAIEYVHRVGRTARLEERGDSFLFIQPVEMDYLKDVEKLVGVTLPEFSLPKLLQHFPHFGENHRANRFISTESHPWVVTLQKALEGFTSSQPIVKSLAQKAFCSWVRAYAAHRGELKKIFMVKKLHLGHVAKSFALKEQPSLVVKSFQKQTKKRERDEKHKGLQNKRKRNDKQKFIGTPKKTKISS